MWVGLKMSTRSQITKDLNGKSIFTSLSSLCVTKILHAKSFMNQFYNSCALSYLKVQIREWLPVQYQVKCIDNLWFSLSFNVKIVLQLKVKLHYNENGSIIVIFLFTYKYMRIIQASVYLFIFVFFRGKPYRQHQICAGSTHKNPGQIYGEIGI